MLAKFLFYLGFMLKFWCCFMMFKFWSLIIMWICFSVFVVLHGGVQCTHWNGLLFFARAFSELNGCSRSIQWPNEHDWHGLWACSFLVSNVLHLLKFLVQALKSKNWLIRWPSSLQSVWFTKEDSRFRSFLCLANLDLRSCSSFEISSTFCRNWLSSWRWRFAACWVIKFC